MNFGKAVLPRRIGAGIVLASSVYVVYQLVVTDFLTVIASHGAGLIVAGTIGVLIYASAGALLGFGWAALLQRTEEPDRSRTQLIALYGRTQIAKYLPGNVFHFVSRHALARSLGYSHLALTQAAIYEAVGLILAAMAVSIAGSTMTNISFLGLAGVRGVGVAIIIVTALYIVGAVVAPRLLAGMDEVRTVPLAVRVRTLLIIGSIYTLFFALAGGIVVILASSVASVSISSGVLVISAAAVAWLVGFIVPGASAGLGVRETVLILALSQSFEPSTATAVAVLYRAVTMGGDLVFAAVAQAMDSFAAGR